MKNLNDYLCKFNLMIGKWVKGTVNNGFNSKELMKLYFL